MAQGGHIDPRGAAVAGRHFGIRKKLLLSFSAITALSVIGSAVGWGSLDTLNRSISGIANRDIPSLSAANGVAAASAQLVALAPRLMAAGTEKDLSAVSGEATALEAQLGRQIAAAGGYGVPVETVHGIRTAVDGIGRNLKAIDEAMRNRMGAEAALATASDAVDALNRQFGELLQPMVAETERRTQSSYAKLLSITQSLQSLSDDARSDLVAAYELRLGAAAATGAIRAAALAWTPDAVAGARQSYEEAVSQMGEGADRLKERLSALNATEAMDALSRLSQVPASVFTARNTVIDPETPPERRPALQAQLDGAADAAAAADRLIEATIGRLLAANGDSYSSGSGDLNDQASTALQGLVFDEFAALRGFLELKADVNRIAGLLGNAVDAPNSAGLAAVEARFTSIVQRFRPNLERLAMPGMDDTAIKGGPAAAEPVRRLLALGDGNAGIFALRRKMLAADADSDHLMAANMTAAAGLAKQVADLVTGAEAAAKATAANAATTATAAQTLLLFLAAASVAGSAILVWLVVGRNIADRLVALAEAMRALANGRLDHPFRVGGGDEIAAMASALAVFRDTAREVETANARTEEERERAARQRRQDMLALADELEANVKSAVEALSERAEDMQAMANDMMAAAERNRIESGSAAATADQTRSNVQTVAVAAQELSASIVEIGRRVSESARFSREATSEASSTDGTVRSLQDAAAEIGEVVELIGTIAAQTNLLALNATIEAARAGEVGRGFAVVAGEVKGLASQTAKATERIERQVTAIQIVSGRAADAIHRISDMISTIDSIASGIAASVEQQAAATLEIGRNVDQAANGTQALFKGMDVVSSTAIHTKSVSTKVQTSSDAVLKHIQQLQADVNWVLKNIRST